MRAMYWVSVTVVFIVVATIVANSGGDPTGGLGYRAAGLILLGVVASGVGIVFVAIRHRQKLARQAGDLSLNVAASVVRAGRRIGEQARTLKEAIDERSRSH